MNQKQLVKFVETLAILKQKLKCPICLDIIQEVVELDCGHKYCDACYSECKAAGKLTACLLCKHILKKRAEVYKDTYASNLGRFVYKCCVNIHNCYNCSVEQLQAKLNKDDILVLKENVPSRVEKNRTLPSTSKLDKKSTLKESVSSKEHCEDAFDKLIKAAKVPATFNKRGTTRVYKNTKKLKKKPDVEYNILEFDNYENKEAVLCWLNDTRNRFDRLTQTQNLCNEEEDVLPIVKDMVSISQVKERSSCKPLVNKCVRRGRAKSLNIEVKKVIPKERKRHTDGGSEVAENYDIEDINTEEEEVVKKAEEKVLLDLMEDQLLDKLESEMQNKLNTEETEKLGKESKINSQISTTGWDRITKMKKTIKKGGKVPKQLNVTLQSTQSVKNETKEMKTVDLQPDQIDVAHATNLDDNNPTSKPFKRLNRSKEEKVQSYDLHQLEDYIAKNIEIIEHDTSLDSNITSSLPAKALAFDTKKIPMEVKEVRIPLVNENIITFLEGKKDCENRKDNVAFNDNSDKIKDSDCIIINDDDDDNLEELYSRPTQGINCPSASDGVKVHYNTLSELLNLLEETVKKCTENLKFTDIVENQLLSMKDYISKMKSLKTTPPVGPVKEAPVTCDATAQTDLQTTDETVQTEVNNSTVETQTTDVCCRKCNADLGQTEARSISQNTKNAISSMLSDPDFNFKSVPQCTSPNKSSRTTPGSKQLLQNEIFSSTFDNLKFETQDVTKNQGIILSKSQVQTNNNKNANKSLRGQNLSLVDDNKLKMQRDRADLSKQTPQNLPGSVLVCTLETTNRSTASKADDDKTGGANTSRRFKRIRMQSDSDSDEETQPKRLCNRFVRDDLTVEFQTNMEEVRQGTAEKDSNLESQNSENINYDDYLAQIMKKYENDTLSIPLEKEKPAIKTQTKEIIRDIVSKCEKMIHQASKNIQNIKEMAETSSSKESFQTASQNMIDNFDEALTADKAFMDENNLQKIDSAIENYEKDDTVAQSSEISDVVVGTEEMEPLPKKSKRTISHKGNPQPTRLFCRSENDGNPGAVEKLDRLCTELNDSFDEVQFDKIQVCEEQNNLKNSTTDQNSKINIINDVKIKSAEKPEARDKEEDDLFSDEDIVESTPQKKISSFVERSVLTSIDNIPNLLMKDDLPNPLTEVEDFDYSIDMLPPPPDFQDEIQESNDSHRDPTVIELEATATNVNKGSLTPDKLSQFIIAERTVKDDGMPELSPCILPYNKENQEEHANLSLTPEKLSQLEANHVRKGISHSTPVTQRNVTSETLGFSPISAQKGRRSNIIEMGHASKYTPLSLVTKTISQKQNILTSTPKQKSILNYIKSSQSDDETSPVAKTKPCIACTRLSKDQIKFISQLTGKKLATYNPSFDSSVTHMIVAVNESNCVKDYTIKFVSAVAAGIWVLRFEWIEECLRKNCIVPEEPYEALDTSELPGPKISRLTREINPLFKGYKFYCADPFISTTRQEVEDIIRMLGGKVLSDLKALLQNDGNVGLIIGEGHATQDFEQYERWAELYKAVTVDIEWLSRCVGQYKLVSFRPYVWCSEDNLGDLGYPPYLTETVPLSFTETF